MLLVMVRHGQSTWNLEGRIQGQAMAVPLTPEGEGQACVAAAEVARLVPRGTPVLCSDQLRARQSAAPVAEALGVAAEPTPLLREQSLGDLEGRLARELQPEPLPAGVDVADVAWGGGESLRDVHQRGLELLDLLRGKRLAAIVLVGHGDALRVLEAAATGRGHREVNWREWPNGVVRCLDLPAPPR